MAAICAQTCGTIQDPPSSYHGCEDLFRNFGFNHFTLIKCDYQFTDILDVSEWTAAVTSGDVRLSPEGKAVINPPTTSSFEITGCGREIPGEGNYLVDFTTYQFGGFTNNVPDSVTYWRDVFRYVSSYRIMLPDCDNTGPLFYIDDQWMDQVGGGAPATVANSNPGFEFSVTTPPHLSEGEQRKAVWTTQFSIKKTGVMEAALLPGVFSALA